MNSTSNRGRENGQVIVLLALLLPMILALGGAVIAIGNWYVHAKNLQTKADAGALGGGSAWSFPCSPDASNNIVNNARYFAGPSGAPVATPVGGNPQVGGVQSSKIHTVLNGDTYYDDDSNSAPTEFNSPSGSVCDNRILDVKMTEDNSFPLASLIPLFPDIKRNARVQIEEAAGLQGLLPISVRVPKPLSAAAIYVDETPGPTYGNVLSARFFNDVCEPPNFTGCLTMPTALDQWTTDDGSGGNRADIASMPSQVGVVVGLSFRPACPGAIPCFSIDTSTYRTVDAMCNQGGSERVQCFYATTPRDDPTQTVQSGLQFIRGYSPNPEPGDPAPDLLDVWFDTATPTTNCFQGYFSAPVANSCNVVLHANIDPGFGGEGSYEIRYKLVSGDTAWQEDDAPGPCGDAFNAECVMTSGVADVTLDQQYARHAAAIAIYRYNIPDAVRVANNLPADCGDADPTPRCVWYFPDNGGNVRGTNNPPTTNAGNVNIFSRPVQRAFMGDIDKSGPVKFLHLYNVDCTTGAVIAGVGETGLAASVQTGNRCFKLEMGLQGALAREQDEHPIVLNIGKTSQSAVVDCDPAADNLKSEIQQGCSLQFKKNDFTTTDPATGKYCPNQNMPQLYQSPTAPFNSIWPPFTCVATQAAAQPDQIDQGLSLRFFGVSNNPRCPADNAEFVPGRNYWHDANNDFTGDPDGAGPEPSQADYYTFTRSSRNHGNHLRTDDPRFVLLFITPYNSFTGRGNETFPIAAIGGFYITGYGVLLGNGNWQGNAPTDPCDEGNGDGIGAGNTPPPDLNMNNNGAVAWGHFVVPVNLGTSQGGTGLLCQPSSLTACVPVLVK